MGKNLIQQHRGRGSPTYRAPSFRYSGKVRLNKVTVSSISGVILDLIHCQGHSAPLMHVLYDNEEEVLMSAPEGVKVGDVLMSGLDVEVKPGNVLPLKNIPEGTDIYNIESIPGDCGKFVRTSGLSAKIVNKTGSKVIIKFPSNKEREFKEDCRACIGIIAGAGRIEKPFLKAGKMFHAKRARNKLWPIVSGVSMNAVTHPFGGRSSAHKGRPLQAGRDYPPGRKVGSLAPQKKKKK